MTLFRRILFMSLVLAPVLVAGESDDLVFDFDQKPVEEISQEPVSEPVISPADEARSEALALLENSNDLDLETRVLLARKLVANFPDIGQLWSVLGELRLEADQDTDALMAFERAVAKDDSLGSSWHWIGIIKKRQNRDLGEAIEAFEKAMERGMPRDVELNEIAVTMTRQGRLEDALSTWVEAIEINPDWGVLFSNAIKGATMLGMDEEGRGIFLRGMNAERFDERTVLGWTDYLVREGREKDAIRDYDLAVEKHPDLARIRYYYGATLRDLKMMDEAVVQFDQAVLLAAAVNDEATRSASEKAVFDLKFPDKAKALVKAEKYIFKEDLSSEKDFRRVRESIEELDKIVSEHPTFWEPLLMRGVAHRRIGEWDKARADFNEVLGLAPDQPNATLNIGLIHQDKGEFDQAVTFAQRAMDTAPTDPFIQLNGIFVLINTQRCDEAVAAIKKSGSLLTEDILGALETALQGACQ